MYQPTTLVSLLLALSAASQPSVHRVPVSARKALVQRVAATGAWARHYGRVLVGLLTLQVVVALPIIGRLLGLVASLLGVGALVARSWAERERTQRAPVMLPAAA